MTRTTNARIAGVTYLFYIAVAFPAMVMFGRATAGQGISTKLASIAEHATELRISILLVVLSCFCALVLAVTLYAIRHRTNTMTSRKRTARLAGALYVLMSLLGAISLTYFPSRFFVPGDPAATAAKIESAKLLYRVCVLIDLTGPFVAIWLAVTLYQLFQDVDKRQTQLLVATLLVQVPMLFAVALIQLAPLVVLNGASYWSAFDKPQLDALAHGFLSWRSQGIGAISAYWGLWLVPLGVLVYKSVFIPRIIGVFLIIAACTYVVSALTFFLLPAYYRTVFWYGGPLYGLGEAGFIGYVLIKGVRAERLEAA